VKTTPQIKALDLSLSLFVGLIAVSLFALPLLPHGDLDDRAISGSVERGLFHDCVSDLCDCETGSVSAIVEHAIHDPIFESSLLHPDSPRFALPLALFGVFHPPSHT
jgi:hypothetical protein